MIQFKRGETTSWRRSNPVLYSGQPGYDKTRHKIKVGDGKTPWTELPFASGLSAEEVFDSEAHARLRISKDEEDKTIITYGTEFPNEETVGQIYLQHYEYENETDYIVEFGTNGIWTYEKRYSGIAKCWGTLAITTSVENTFEGSDLYYDLQSMTAVNYPFAFLNIPVETATVQSPGGMAWLSNRGRNSTTTSGVYSIISLDSLNSAAYNINIQVEGFWR